MMVGSCIAVFFWITTVSEREMAYFFSFQTGKQPQNPGPQNIILLKDCTPAYYKPPYPQTNIHCTIYQSLRLNTLFELFANDI